MFFFENTQKLANLSKKPAQIQQMSSIQIPLSTLYLLFPFFHCFCHVWNISESINADNLI